MAVFDEYVEYLKTQLYAVIFPCSPRKLGIFLQLA